MTCPTGQIVAAHNHGAVAVHKETGEAVFEFMRGDPRLPFVNTTAFELVPTLDYLVSINGSCTSPCRLLKTKLGEQ